VKLSLKKGVKQLGAFIYAPLPTNHKPQITETSGKTPDGHKRFISGRGGIKVAVRLPVNLGTQQTSSQKRDEAPVRPRCEPLLRHKQPSTRPSGGTAPRQPGPYLAISSSNAPTLFLTRLQLILTHIHQSSDRSPLTVLSTPSAGPSNAPSPSPLTAWPPRLAPGHV
jgi:hypothetical protein